jgi:hypothetical protein
MAELLFFRLGARARRVFAGCLAALALSAVASAQTPPASAPVLLTEGTGQTTRGVAYESVLRTGEPFALTTPIAWSTDTRTRITVFVMNLQLLAGEGASALTADAEDASGRRYPLKVESLSTPNYDVFDVVNKAHVGVPQGWLFAVVLRLSDDLPADVGDVLVSVSLHGVSSNRVRVAIGHAGGGPSTDATTEFVAAAPAATPTPMPPLTLRAATRTWPACSQSACALTSTSSWARPRRTTQTCRSRSTTRRSSVPRRSA